MYDNNYENYIRSILGYPSNSNFNQNGMYNVGYSTSSQVNMRNDLEQSYPEIYRIIYPMVQKACERNMTANTTEEIERMTDEIYSALEDNNQINVNINLGNNISATNVSGTENRSESTKEVVQPKKVETRNDGTQDRRVFSNNNLRDLIKILLIRELLRRRNNNFPHRPPHNNQPCPPMRPPIMPREYQPLYDIYEY